MGTAGGKGGAEWETGEPGPRPDVRAAALSAASGKRGGGACRASVRMCTWVEGALNLGGGVVAEMIWGSADIETSVGIWPSQLPGRPVPGRQQVARGGRRLGRRSARAGRARTANGLSAARAPATPTGARAQGRRRLAPKAGHTGVVSASESGQPRCGGRSASGHLSVPNASSRPKIRQPAQGVGR